MGWYIGKLSGMLSGEFLDFFGEVWGRYLEILEVGIELERIFCYFIVEILLYFIGWNGFGGG